MSTETRLLLTFSMWLELIVFPAQDGQNQRLADAGAFCENLNVYPSLCGELTSAGSDRSNTSFPAFLWKKVDSEQNPNQDPDGTQANSPANLAVLVPRWLSSARLLLSVDFSSMPPLSLKSRGVNKTCRSSLMKI